MEAMLKQLANKAVSGDLRAIREVLKRPVETGNGGVADGWRSTVSGASPCPTRNGNGNMDAAIGPSRR
jgi:hypothetical protein